MTLTFIRLVSFLTSHPYITLVRCYIVGVDFDFDNKAWTSTWTSTSTTRRGLRRGLWLRQQGVDFDVDFNFDNKAWTSKILFPKSSHQDGRNRIYDMFLILNNNLRWCFGRNVPPHPRRVGSGVGISEGMQPKKVCLPEGTLLQYWYK